MHQGVINIKLVFQVTSINGLPEEGQPWRKNEPSRKGGR
jgi:hypothetical protein